MIVLIFLFPQPRHAVKLLSVLNQMPQRHGPDTFFNFPGCSAAVSFKYCVYVKLLKVNLNIIKYTNIKSTGLCFMNHCV